MMLRSLVFTASVFLTGCATLIAPFSSQPMDLNQGERTWGATIEDQSIETKIRVNLKRAGAPLNKQRIIAVSYNGNVLLAGQVSSEDIKTQAGNIAERTRHVRHLHNELEVIGTGSMLIRTNDAWITSKVKTRLAFARKAPASRTKVVTENGVVYLFGLLTREEADAVVAQTQKVYGVQKIVKIIEYIENP